MGVCVAVSSTRNRRVSERQLRAHRPCGRRPGGRQARQTSDGAAATVEHRSTHPRRRSRPAGRDDQRGQSVCRGCRLRGAGQGALPRDELRGMPLDAVARAPGRRASSLGRWRYGGTDAAVFETIFYGRPRGMPAFGGILPPELTWKLVTFLRSIPPPKGRADAVVAVTLHFRCASNHATVRSILSR